MFRGCLLALLIIICGCASPAKYSSGNFDRYDKDTEYRLDERNDGFVITVNYQDAIDRALKATCKIEVVD
jgi:hypothetical protein